ncbi:MAG: hypothetical protein ACYSUI_13515 [Planctomycetota bacterium]|jgi:hypothetical protein
MENLSTRQLGALGLVIALSGAGGSLMARAPSAPVTPALTHIAVLREEQKRQEARITRLRDRVRSLEVSLAM